MTDPLLIFDGDAATPKLVPASDDAEPSSSIVMTTLADIESRDVEFLWQNRFPLGMVSVICGDPSAGKSTWTTDIAARISAGTPWPDLRDTPNPPGNVILLVGEDGLGDTVRRRVDAAGGDPSRIEILEGIRYADCPEIVEPFAIDRDLPRLDLILSERKSVRAIFIDPLDCFLGPNIDTHRKSEVQRALSGLAKLAERHAVAMIGVLHLRKSSGSDKALYRTLGSLGFVSAPRAVWAVTRDREDRSKRLITCVKCNVAPDPTGMSFTIEDQNGIGVIHWADDPVTLTADDAMDERPRSRSTRDDASEWLLEMLALGPVSSDRLRDEAQKNSYSWSTLKRAKTDLSVRAKKHADGWHWELPKETTSHG
jgi:putative DNA primase/helicase